MKLKTRFYILGLGVFLLQGLNLYLAGWSAEPLKPETATHQATSLPQASTPSKPETFTAEEEQGIPLAELKQEQASQAADDGTLPRMLASLIVVVLLLYGSLKYGLPKLAERFPTLFQSLQSGKDARSLLNLQGFETLKKASPFSSANDAEKFKLISTKIIGVGKELHLVEIKGRQLVIGATAQQITLLTELPNQENLGSPFEEASSQYQTEPPNRLN